MGLCHQSDCKGKEDDREADEVMDKETSFSSDIYKSKWRSSDFQQVHKHVIQ